MQAPTAQTILCDACGGRIPLQGIPASVVCPFCRREQTISEGRRRELASYQRGVGGALSRASAEQSQVEQWKRYYGGRGARSKYAAWAAPILAASLMLPFLVMGIAAQLWMSSSGKPLPEFVGPVMTVVGLGFFAIVFVIYLVWWYGGREPSDGAGVALATATCPQCGAPNQLAPGQVLERCTHCGASLMPSATLMRVGLGAAEAAAHEATMRHYRAEREGAASLMRVSLAGGVPYIIVGSLLPMTVGGAVAFTADALQHDRTSDWPGVLALWAVGSVNVGMLVAVFMWRRLVRLRWAAILAEASQPFGHRILTGLDEMVRWLNGYWAGPVPLGDLTVGGYFQASMITVGTLPGLIVINPTSRGEGAPVYTAVFLATWIPTLHGRGAPNEAQWASCRAMLGRWGFLLTAGEAGLVARADADVVKRLKQDPNAASVLTTIAKAMGEAAHAAGAVPVERMPA